METAAAETADALLGRWRIESWLQHYDDGRLVHPMGEAPSGFIHYDAAGTMSCMIARASRPPFAGGGQWTGTTAEKAAAYDSMLAYAGRYEINGAEVLHYVQISLFPNWVGGIQRRRFALAGDRLDLLTRLEDGTSEARLVRISWSRDRQEDGPMERNSG